MIARCPVFASRRSRRGFSLLEVVVASTLLLLVLTIVGQLTVGAFRTYKRSDIGVSAYRHAVSGLDALMRELRGCEEIVFPLSARVRWSAGRELNTALGQSCTVIMRRRGLDGDRATHLALCYDGEQGVVRRHLLVGFRASSLPQTNAVVLESLEGVAHSRVVATGVKGLSFWTVPASECFGACLAGVRLEVALEEAPATGSVNVAGGGANLGMTSESNAGQCGGLARLTSMPIVSEVEVRGI